MQTYDFHPLCSLYPLMPQGELQRIADDIRENGYDSRFPIYLYQGQILDGRNRYLAARMAEVEPLYKNLTPDAGEDLESFVHRANEHRRHLSVEWLQAARQERIGRTATAKQAGESTRTIAEREKVSQQQVMRDLQAATETGVSVAPTTGKVVGKDGSLRTPKPAKERDLRCERCKRLNIDAPGCLSCRKVKADYFTDKHRRRAKPAKSGDVAFNFEEYDKPLGELIRWGDRVAAHYKIKNRPLGASIVRRLSEFHDWIMQLKEDVRKLKGKTDG